MFSQVAFSICIAVFFAHHSAAAEAGENVVRWFTEEVVDVESRARSVDLVFGLPDASLLGLGASCSAGDESIQATFVMSMDGAQDGSIVQVFVSSSTIEQNYQGFANLGNNGLSGFTISLTKEDALWDELKRGEPIVVRTNQGAFNIFDAPAEPTVIDAFLAKCSS